MIIFKTAKNDIVFVSAPARIKCEETDVGWRLTVYQYVGGGRASTVQPPEPAEVMFILERFGNYNDCMEKLRAIGKRLNLEEL